MLQWLQTFLCPVKRSWNLKFEFRDLRCWSPYQKCEWKWAYPWHLAQFKVWCIWHNTRCIWWNYVRISNTKGWSVVNVNSFWFSETFWSQQCMKFINIFSTDNIFGVSFHFFTSKISDPQRWLFLRQRLKPIFLILSLLNTDWFKAHVSSF